MAKDTFSALFGDSRTGGAANKRSDALPPDSRPANSSVRVRYRDARNFKISAVFVLAGRFEDEDLALISSKLYEVDGFIPSQVGLEDLQSHLQQYSYDHYYGDDDHVWHELDLPEAVTRTDDEPTTTLTWQDLVENFANVEYWDESAVDLSPR